MLKNLTFAVILTVGSLALADEKAMTDWLDSLSGSTGNLVGAEVIGIEKRDKFTILDIRLPESQLSETDIKAIELEKRDESLVQQFKKPTTLLDDDSQPYGVRFYLKRRPDFEFRLRLHDELNTKQK